MLQTFSTFNSLRPEFLQMFQSNLFVLLSNTKASAILQVNCLLWCADIARKYMLSLCKHIKANTTYKIQASDLQLAEADLQKVELRTLAILQATCMAF